MEITLESASLNLAPALKLGLSSKAAEKMRYISNLFVPSEDRRKGLATRLMKQVIDEYDQEGISLLLNPDPEEGIDEKSLLRFYSKLGFERIQTDPVVLMVRHPKQNEIKKSVILIADAYGRVQ